MTLILIKQESKADPFSTVLFDEFGSGGIARSNRKEPGDFYSWASISVCLQYLRNTSEEFRYFEKRFGTIGVKVSHTKPTAYDYMDNSIRINPISFTHDYLDTWGGFAPFNAEFITNHEFQEAIFLWKYIDEGFISNHCNIIQAANAMPRYYNTPNQACADRNGTLDSRIGGDWTSRENDLRKAEAKLLGEFY